MTQDQFDSLLEQLKDYKQKLNFSEREKEEYINGIIFYFENNENHFVDENLSLDDIFDELREQQEWNDGGSLEVMSPDVNEEDEEYPDGYDPCDNEEYCIHSELLDELREYLEI